MYSLTWNRLKLVGMYGKVPIIHIKKKKKHVLKKGQDASRGGKQMIPSTDSVYHKSKRTAGGQAASSWGLSMASEHWVQEAELRMPWWQRLQHLPVSLRELRSA